MPLDPRNDHVGRSLHTLQDADDLGVAPGSPVACGRNWWYGRDGEVIEYGERVSIPGRWSSHRYEIAVNGGG